MHRKLLYFFLLLMPILYSCESNVMDPMTSDTTYIFRFTLQKSFHIKISINDSYNNHVITLIDDELPAGSYEGYWTYTDSEGVKVCEGIYFLEFYVDNRLEEETKILLRN